MQKSAILIKTSGFAGFNIKIYKILIIIPALEYIIPAVGGLVKKIIPAGLII